MRVFAFSAAAAFALSLNPFYLIGVDMTAF